MRASIAAPVRNTQDPLQLGLLQDGDVPSFASIDSLMERPDELRVRLASIRRMPCCAIATDCSRLSKRIVASRLIPSFTKRGQGMVCSPGKVFGHGGEVARLPADSC